MMNGEAREQRVNEAIAEFLAACDAGTPPDRETFLAKHADVADSVRSFLVDHDQIRRAATPTPLRGPAETATLPSNGLPQPAAPELLGSIKYFGDYELLGEIARGGMGVVYKARQVSLNRVVAVKMILAGAYAGPRDVQRFHVEAEAAARLDHPHILPIYEVGEHQGHQYFSMKLVDGGSFLQDAAPDPRAPVLTLTKVCRAVHFAHQRGILHRDLKPKNILIEADGTPYVTDFGLAKKVEGDSALTQSGAVVGTPSYMPPEQARGEKGVSTAADVYSLGAILYEIITGRPPFREATVVDTVLAVIDREPTHPRTVNPSAERDLSSIALKCLEKQPGKRYPSAAALADDLERWANGEPIQARPAPSWEKAWKWARRRPSAAALLATCLLALVGGITGLAISNRAIAMKQKETDAALRDRTAALDESAASLLKAVQARQDTAAALGKVSAEQALTKKALAAERRAAYLSDIALAANEWAGNRPIRAAQLLDGCPVDLRGWEWHHLQRVAHAAEVQYPDTHGSTSLNGLRSDGKRILTTDRDAVRIRDFATGKVIRAFTDHEYEVSAAAFSPDGKRVASGATEMFSISGQAKCEVILWDAETGIVLRTFATDLKGVRFLTFSPDGKWLAVAGGDKTIRLWEADGSKEVHRFTLAAASGWSAAGLAFSPDSKQLAAGGSTLIVWDVEKKTEIRSLKGEGAPAYSPDGKLLATIRTGTELVVRDAATGTEQFAQRIDAQGLTTVVFAPDGKRIALGSLDGIVRVWELATKTEVQAIRGQQGWVMGLIFSPDGTRLATSVSDPLGEAFGELLGRSATPEGVRVWDLGRGQDYRLLPGTDKAFAVHPTRPEVAVAAGTEIVIYDAATGAKLRSFVSAPVEIVQLAYSPDGATLALAWSIPDKVGKEISPGVTQRRPVKNPHRLQLLDAVTGKPKSEPHVQETSIGVLLFSPDGTILAATGWGKTLTLFDAGTGKMLANLDGADGGASRLAFGPKGLLVRATTGSIHGGNVEPGGVVDGVIEVWDVPGRKQLRTVNAGKGFCHAIAVSPDGNLLAASVGDGVVVIQLDTGTQKTLPTPAHSLAFSPDGQRLAAATPVGVKFWDPVSGRDILTLGGKWSPGGNTSRIAFARSDGLVLVNEMDGLRVYDGRAWTAPAQPTVVAPPKAPEPKKDPPSDDRPDAVKLATAQAAAALDANDPAAAALHAVAALAADADPVRQQTHRLRIALALQATPRLRPVVPPGSMSPTAFAADEVVDPSGTANVLDPRSSRYSFQCRLRVSADGARFAAWNATWEQEDGAEAQKAGRSNWWLRVYDAATGKPVGPAIDLRDRAHHCVALSPDGKRVAALFLRANPAKKQSGAVDPKEPKVAVVRMWDAETANRIGGDLTVPRHENANPELHFAAGGRILVATGLGSGWSNDRSQAVWDLDTGALLAPPEPAREVYDQPGDAFVLTAPGGSGRRGNIAHVRDARTLAVVGKPLAVSEVRAAATSADGLRVAVANSYWLGTWDTKTGERLHPRFAVYGGAKCVAIAPDGSRFAAGFKQKDGTAVAQVWDAATGDALSPPIKTGTECRAVRFVADGPVLLTVAETTVRLWDARTGEPLTPLLSTAGYDSYFDRHEVSALIVGESMLVRRTSEMSQFDRWSLAADGRSVEKLRELAEAVAGRRRDAVGNLQPIPTDELFVLRKRSAEQFPEQFGKPVPSPDAILTRRSDPRMQQLAEWLADVKITLHIRCAAAERLGGLNDPAGQGPLVAALRDPAPEIRRAAAGALGKSEPRAAETIQALTRALTEEKDDGARALAARALHGPAARAATTELLRALMQDKAADVREAAAFALRGAAPDPTLRAALRSAFAAGKPWSLRIEAATSSAFLFADDTDSIGVLAAAAEMNERWVRRRAAENLGEFGPRAAPATAALTKIVEKGSYQPHVIEETWYALRALGKIGPAAKPAIPALLIKLNQDESNPHMYTPATNYVPVHDNMVAFTLARIGPDAVPPLLKVFKEDKDSHRRRAAVLALGYVGPPAKAAVADLEAEVKKLADLEERTEDDAWLATALEKALGRIRNAKALALDKME